MKNYTIFLVPATLLMMAHKILSPDFVIHNPVLPEYYGMVLKEQRNMHLPL